MTWNWCRMGYHKWSKWETKKHCALHDSKDNLLGYVLYQTRHCENCNKVDSTVKRQHTL